VAVGEGGVWGRSAGREEGGGRAEGGEGNVCVLEGGGVARG
jgi:hypothetical protein